MTTSKARTTTARRQTAPAATSHTQDERFTFGVTLQQLDQFHALLRTITAQSDMVAVCSGAPLDDKSVSILGESIFTAARAVRGIVDQIHAQRLGGDGLAPGSHGEPRHA
ncbi:hypothetical protein [Xanthomonas graminis]|jgi:hypothetical protein|uniref:Uncharacterized protein n=1 Tax=Xanthomonas graminis pv. graminis TaxID=134874 RepID=A0A1M4L7T7_9XANT|nr:hypothetical protein [Xanthomonas translucens]EKU23808.1 hypothetical protein XTG29_03409 [Xanthomonas translucens pv. graminis ART-Xtg29]OAX59120.1 hypothetical protein A6R72_17530 [Xanthomonas translucens pv. graminis]UKE54147.1 hypothetical protein KFS84_18725 [Xanthomonas translucens pv. graminis]WIH09166.1 hypothetical protein KM579_02930 [Xanthomonas translucens pv. graminis]WIH12049.1 hypothetical protein KM563_18840 [Xanthomonas translucens pv. graminis]